MSSNTNRNKALFKFLGWKVFRDIPIEGGLDIGGIANYALCPLSFKFGCKGSDNYPLIVVNMFKANYENDDNKYYRLVCQMFTCLELSEVTIILFF